MRILLLTQIVPYPPDSGPKIKTHHVLRYLAARHELHLVSFVRSADEVAAARELEGYCASVTTVPILRSRFRDGQALLTSLVRGRSFLIERDDSLTFREAVSALLARYRFDAVHADQLTMAQFAVNLPLPLRVLDEHNAVWLLVQRLANRLTWGPRRIFAELEWRRIRRYEGQICRRFDQVTVVSDDDRAALEVAAEQPIPVRVIPITVDTAEWEPLPRPARATSIVSVATMFYPPNVEGLHWFASQVFPRVREQVPGAELTIVGSRPPAQIRDLAGADRGITVTGYVADLEPILRLAAVMIVPLHSGSGMRVKILEAFARGIPVVTTSLGVEGIAAVPGEQVLTGDTPSAFAEQVVRILTDPDEAARLARAGRDLVERRYDRRVALGALDEIYQPPNQHTAELPPNRSTAATVDRPLCSSAG